jgi:beta-mannosidase
MSIQTNPRIAIDLSGTWNYKVDAEDVGVGQEYYAVNHDRSSWGQMQVPNNWYLTEVGDYFGAVWFQTSFRVPEELAGKRLTLRFGAVDYYADVWLNGTYLGRHEGIFTPFEFDVTQLIRTGEDNVLVVRDDAPRDPTEYLLVEDAGNLSTPMSTPYKRHWAKDLTLIKGHFIDAMHRPGAMTKLRGDGNSGGIWRPVELVAQGDVQIKGTKIYTKIVAEDDSALVSIDLDLNNSTRRLITTTVQMIIRPKNFAGGEIVEKRRSIQLQPGRNKVKLVQTISAPQLWWTWDHGEPNLYEIEFTVGGDPDLLEDRQIETFGIKEIQKDEQGQWYLNGRRLFIRGMRYLSSLWLSEIGQQQYQDDLQKMLDMKINSIRIGSHVEHPLFYEMCDEMGFLVWQVFPMHYCYSDSDDLIERAAPMMKQMVEMLHNHACMGMWSVFKEPKIYGLPNKPNNYGRLCQILYETARTVDPIRWVHTGDYEEGVQNLMIGGVRPGDTDMKRVKIEPQLVEFGAIGIPVLETLKTFIPEDKLWPPDWDTWEYWGLFYNLMFGFAKIEMGNSLVEFIDNSQSYEAKVIKEQIELFRQRKYQPVASMYLYYWNDACPCIGSGLFDYYRRPYKAYEAMKAVYTPVLVSLEWNKDPYVLGFEKRWYPGETFVGRLWITNDHHRTFEDAMLNWRLVSISEQRTLLESTKRLTIPYDSAQVVDEVKWEVLRGMQGAFQLQMCVEDKQGELLSKNTFDFNI